MAAIEMLVLASPWQAQAMQLHHPSVGCFQTDIKENSGGAVAQTWQVTTKAVADNLFHAGGPQLDHADMYLRSGETGTENDKRLGADAVMDVFVLHAADLNHTWVPCVVHSIGHSHGTQQQHGDTMRGTVSPMIKPRASDLC